MKYFAILISIFLFLPCCLRAQDKEPLLVDSLIQLPTADSLLSLTPLDSLNKGSLAIESIESKASSLQDSLKARIQLSDSLLPKGPVAPLTQRIDSLRLEAGRIADSLENKAAIPDSLSRFLPEETEFLNKEDLPELGVKPLEEIKEAGAMEDIEDLEELKEVEGLRGVEGLKDVEEVEVLTEKAGEWKEITEKGDQLSETAESEVKNIKEIQALEAQSEVLGKEQEKLGQLQDQQYYKAEALNTAKEKATDHFANHTEKLQAAQEKLAEVKRKYPEGVSSIKDLPKRRPNPMKGKPFKERLILGLTIQIHPDQTPNIDLAPFAAYKISERLSLGLGGGYRLMTRDNLRGFTREGAVYGFRGFSEFKMHKGFFIHAEYEVLKAAKRDSLMFKVQEVFKEKVWVDGLLVGIGKDYNITRYIKGNMQVLYNFLDEINSPYRDKVMVRFGFNFQLKDKLKKPDLSQELNPDNAKKRAKKLLKKQSEKIKNEADIF